MANNDAILLNWDSVTVSCSSACELLDRFVRFRPSRVRNPQLEDLESEVLPGQSFGMPGIASLGDVGC